MNTHLLTQRYVYTPTTNKIKYVLSRNTDEDAGVHMDWDLYDRLNNKNPEPEYRGTIEVPANAETVIYESPEGELYEIPVSDLIEADDDNEIEYKSKQRTQFKSRHQTNKKHLNYNVLMASTRNAIYQR